MLYLFLPPVIVIICIAFLIYFLSRRMQKLPSEEIESHMERDRERRKLARAIDFGRLNHGALALLEKVTQWLKGVFLGVNNRFEELIRKIREKKKEVREGIVFHKRVEVGVDRKDDSIGVHEETDMTVTREMTAEEERVAPRHGNDAPAYDFFDLKNSLKEAGVLNGDVEAAREEAEEEGEPEPMLAKEIVHPDSKKLPKVESAEEPMVEERSELEEILIERIASDPRDVEAYERLGDYYMDRKVYEDAKECFRQVLKLSPMNRRTKLKMKRVERILGR